MAGADNSVAVDEDCDAECGAHDVQQPGLRNRVGIQHQGDAEPFASRTTGALSVAIDRDANEAEQNGTS